MLYIKKIVRNKRMLRLILEFNFRKNTVIYIQDEKQYCKVAYNHDYLG